MAQNVHKTSTLQQEVLNVVVGGMKITAEEERGRPEGGVWWRRQAAWPGSAAAYERQGGDGEWQAGEA